MDDNQTNVEILRFLASLLFVIGLMGGLWYILKKIGVNGSYSLPTSKKRRLKIIEILPIDMRHKAVLLRRDDKDHLVILGPNGETVVEHSIPVREDSHEI
jgi:flagellar protein FliO/FliZ